MTNQQNQPQEVDIKDVIIQDLSSQISEKARQLAETRAQVMYLQQELRQAQSSLEPSENMSKDA